MNISLLIHEAHEAQKNAYAPYSHFSVGAALLGKNGTVYRGCNIENAAYGVSNCAERTAFFKALSEGVREFTAIAIVGGRNDTPHNTGNPCMPCGVCRQVMAEFCIPESFQIITENGADKYQISTLAELLPHGFTGKNLNVPPTEEGGSPS